MVVAFLLSGLVSVSGCEFLQQPVRDPAAKVAPPTGGGGGSNSGGATIGGGTISTAPTISTKYFSGRSKFVRDEPVKVSVSSCAGVAKVLVTESAATPVNPVLSSALDCATDLTLPGFQTNGAYTRYLWFYNSSETRIGSGRAVTFTVDRTGPARPTFGWRSFVGGKLRSPIVVGTFVLSPSELVLSQEVVSVHRSAHCSGAVIDPPAGAWTITTSSTPYSVTLTSNAVFNQSYSFKLRLTDSDGNVGEHCSSVIGGQVAPSVDLDAVAPTATVVLLATQGLMVEGTTASFSVTFTDAIGIESVNLTESSFEILPTVSGTAHSCSIGTIGSASGIGSTTARVSVTVTGCRIGEKFKLRLKAGQGAQDFAGRTITQAAESAEVEVIAPATSISIRGVDLMRDAGELLPEIQVRVFGSNSTEIKSGRVRLELLEIAGSGSSETVTLRTGYFADGASFIDASLNPEGNGAKFSSVRVMRRGRFRIRASYGTLQATSPDIRISWGFRRNNDAASVLTHVNSIVSDAATGTIFSVGTGATTAANQSWTSGVQSVAIATAGTHLLLQKQDKDGNPLKLAHIPNVAPSTVVDATTPETNILLRQSGKLIVLGRLTQQYIIGTAPTSVTISPGPFVAMFNENLALERMASLVITTSTAEKNCHYSDDNLRITAAAVGRDSGRIVIAGYFGNTGVINVCLNRAGGAVLDSRGNSDIFVAELNSSASEDFGRFEWHQVAGSPNHDQALAIVVDPVEGYPIIGGFHNPANTDVGRTYFHLAATGDTAIPGVNCPALSACETLFVAMVSPRGFVWWHQGGTGKAALANTATNRVLTLELSAPDSMERNEYNGILLVGGVVTAATSYTIANFGNQLSIRPSAADGFVAMMTYNFRDLTPSWNRVYPVGGPGADNVRSVRISHDGFVFIAGEFRSLNLEFDYSDRQRLAKSCTATNCADLYIMELDGGTGAWLPRWSRKISSTGSDELEGLLMSDIAGCYVYGSFNASSASAGGQRTFTGSKTFNGFLTRIGAP
jgi:hypothetical protein